MTTLSLSILALSAALVGTAALLRSTVLGYERLRAEQAKERWDERVDEALRRVEGTADRLEALERGKDVLDNQLSGLRDSVVLARTARGRRG